MKNGKISAAAANLFPGYFALVMATGIISIATHLLNMTPIAWTLLIVNLVAYPILTLLLVIRLILFFPRVATDVADHLRGPGFFTVVAGTCVLGSQFLIVAGWQKPAIILWLSGVLLWTLIMYSFFASVTVRENKPPLESGLSGSWLIVVVATQSISVLAQCWRVSSDLLFLRSVCFYSAACITCYSSLIFYRFTFVNLRQRN